jgi:hypothetical protein
MAEPGSWARVQQRRPDPALDAEDGMADRVDAAMHGMQAARAQPPGDRARTDAELDQLAMADDALLAGSHPRHAN